MLHWSISAPSGAFSPGAHGGRRLQAKGAGHSLNDITNENNALSFLMDNGYSLDEIERCIKDGLTFDDMAGAVRAKLARGEAPGARLKFFEGKRFLHNVMVDYLIKNHGVCKINGTIHVYVCLLYTSCPPAPDISTCQDCPESWHGCSRSP